MKDSRITIWTNPQTHSTGTTSNTGPTLDLRQGYTIDGGTMRQMQSFGIGVEILATQATGTAQVTVWEWEVSDDDSTWRKGGFIGLTTHDADDQSVQKLKGALVTSHRYVRLLASNTGTGTSTSVAYAESIGSIPGTFAVSS